MIAGVCIITVALSGWLAMSLAVPRAVLLLAAALVSGLVLSIYSLGVAHVNDRLEPAQMVAASSALLLVNGAAAVLGPILGGLLMERFGSSAYFGTLSVIAATLAFFCLWRRALRGAVPRERRGPAGANLYFDQATLRAMLALSRIGGEKRYALICKEGPVFDAASIKVN